MEKVEAARERNQGPAMWVAEDADSTLYLYGTLHLVPEGLDWQRDDLWEAFAASGTVFMEVEGGERAQLRADVLTRELGYQPAGERLSSDWDDYTTRALEIVAISGDISFAALDSFKPWLAAEIVTLAAAAKAGLSPDMSADAAIRSRARREGKFLQYFETLEDQLRLAADLPYAEQEADLQALLERYNAIGPELQAIADEWVAGDADALGRRLAESVVGESRDRLFTRRNAAWADRLDIWFEDSGTAMAAVGIGHLVGEDSLLTELESRGYSVSRYFAFQGEDQITPIDLKANIPALPTDMSERDR